MEKKPNRYTKEEQEQHKHDWVTCPMCGGSDPYVSGLICGDDRCEDGESAVICCGC